MLNPIKSPQEMLYEQAGLPHFAGGKKVDVVTQFASRIEDAIRRYTRATGKPPSAEEVRQLEDHIRGLSQPTPKPVQTQARLAQQTPFASHLVDEFGRPYQPAIDPKTGRLTTPERAQGFSVKDPFKTTPVSAKARKYVTNENAFTPDEFLNQANTGRTSARTNMRSHTPSSEELIAKQNAAESVDVDVPGKVPEESYMIGEQPRSASEPFASNATAFEQVPAGDIRQEILPAVYPRAGDPKSKFAAEVERARQSFLERGIEPDEEDIINAVIAARNPLRHNYTGENPLAERPVGDPTSGKVSPEMLDWRDRMRMSGQSERATMRSPSDWQPETRREFLLDTTPDTRPSFAQDWSLEDQIDRRRKQVQGKAEGGMMRSPRDMHAELLVNGYGGGGMTGPDWRAADKYDRATATRREDYEQPEDLMASLRDKYGDVRYRPPTVRDRLKGTGIELLQKYGIGEDKAKKVAHTALGGSHNIIPGGISVMDALAMGNIIPNPVSSAALGLMSPMYMEEAGRAIAEGDYLEAAANALPYAGKLARLKPYVGGAAKAFAPQPLENPDTYRSVLERN